MLRLAGGWCSLRTTLTIARAASVARLLSSRKSSAGRPLQEQGFCLLARRWRKCPPGVDPGPTFLNLGQDLLSHRSPFRAGTRAGLDGPSGKLGGGLASG